MSIHNAGRGDSNPPFSRKRSSTVSSLSIFKSNGQVQKLKPGDSTNLSIWVSDSPAVPVVLNHECWPGVSEGDMIEVTSAAQSIHPGFLFIVPSDTSSNTGSSRQAQQQVRNLFNNSCILTIQRSP